MVEDGATRAPINACLAVLGQLHGRTIRTVEGLARDDLPHILAQADGTQCGFCTPGIVMAAWAHTRQGGDAHEALAGNLCRCTGYRPIVEAMGRMADDGATVAAFAPAAAEFEDFFAPSPWPRRWRCAATTPRPGCWPAAPIWGCAFRSIANTRR